MGTRFRKSINLGGGARINISKSGIGYSVGTKGARVTRTARGTTRTTLSAPGTGLSYVSETGKGRKSRNSGGTGSGVSGSSGDIYDILAQIDANNQADRELIAQGTCPGCGGEIDPEQKFCSGCGYKIAVGPVENREEKEAAEVRMHGELCLCWVAIVYFVAFGLLAGGFVAGVASVLGCLLCLPTKDCQRRIAETGTGKVRWGTAAVLAFVVLLAVIF